MRSGFVSIVGRPNAGKSTLLNALVGEKLAIVTPKPQTTRTRVLGILNLPKNGSRPAAQVVLIDTPGVHKSHSSLDRTMAHEIRNALEGCDLVLWIVDATRKRGSEDEYALDLVRKSNTPAFLLLNKIDLIDKVKLLPLIEELRQMHDFGEIIPISARKRVGLPVLLEKITALLPSGPAHFPVDQITDQPVRFMAAEIIREQMLLAMAEEVPYATAVVIERFEEGPKLTKISALIYCERDGQKAIIIGKGGLMLKQIGTSARLQIERMLDTKVFLELFVKVEPDWRQRRDFIEGLDWRRQLE
ncbi:MAG: GTPase Era [Terriglobales bacterium]|jgi:GTP-binding protein Era